MLVSQSVSSSASPGFSFLCHTILGLHRSTIKSHVNFVWKTFLSVNSENVSPGTLKLSENVAHGSRRCLMFLGNMCQRSGLHKTFV